MFNLQGSEIIFILLLALVVLGPEKLPGAIRRVTSLYAELRKLSSGFQDEFKSVLDEPMRDMKSTADLMKNAADPKKIAEEAEREAELEAAAEKKARQARATTSAMEAAGEAHLARSDQAPDVEALPPPDAFADPIDEDDDADADADDETAEADESADVDGGVADEPPEELPAPVRQLSSFDLPPQPAIATDDGSEEKSA